VYAVLLGVGCTAVCARGSTSSTAGAHCVRDIAKHVNAIQGDAAGSEGSTAGSQSASHSSVASGNACHHITLLGLKHHILLAVLLCVPGAVHPVLLEPTVLGISMSMPV
jgi:hypothetical protein